MNVVDPLMMWMHECDQQAPEHMGMDHLTAETPGFWVLVNKAARSAQ